MFGLNAAYGAGYRAGASPRSIRQNEDGTRTLVKPRNPCRGWLRRHFWECGFYTGSKDSLERWLYRRSQGHV